MEWRFSEIFYRYIIGVFCVRKCTYAITDASFSPWILCVQIYEMICYGCMICLQFTNVSDTNVITVMLVDLHNTVQFYSLHFSMMSTLILEKMLIIIHTYAYSSIGIITIKILNEYTSNTGSSKTKIVKHYITYVSRFTRWRKRYGHIWILKQKHDFFSWS